MQTATTAATACYCCGAADCTADFNLCIKMLPATSLLLQATSLAPTALRLIEESYMGVHVGNGTLRGLQRAGHENKPQKASEKQFAASSPKITQTLRREKASGRNKKVSTSAK